METIKSKPTPPYIINKAVENIDDEYLETLLTINFTSTEVEDMIIEVYGVGTYNKENNTLELMDGSLIIEEEDMYKTYDMVKTGIVDPISQQVLKHYLYDGLGAPLAYVKPQIISLAELPTDVVYLCVFRSENISDYVIAETTEAGEVIYTLGKDYNNHMMYKFSTILMCPAIDKATEITISEPIIGKELAKGSVEVITTVTENTISESKNFKYRVEVVSERKNNYI